MAVRKQASSSVKKSQLNNWVNSLTGIVIILIFIIRTNIIIWLKIRYKKNVFIDWLEKM